MTCSVWFHVGTCCFTLFLRPAGRSPRLCAFLVSAYLMLVLLSFSARLGDCGPGASVFSCSVLVFDVLLPGWEAWPCDFSARLEVVKPMRRSFCLVTLSTARVKPVRAAAVAGAVAITTTITSTAPAHSAHAVAQEECGPGAVCALTQQSPLLTLPSSPSFPGSSQWLKKYAALVRFVSADEVRREFFNADTVPEDFAAGGFPPKKG